MIYFTADQHFGHENIIELVSRPFKKLGIMEKTIIRNHNSVISKDDTVYFVGDLYWGTNLHNLERILKKLNGKKYLILGNHDRIKPFNYHEIGIHQVTTWLTVEEFTVVHDPSFSCIDRTEPFICGHVHDLFRTHKNVINVGVDVFDFTPVSIDIIRKLILK